MRDIFSDLHDGQQPDPMVSARQGAKASLRKRFYKDATAGDQSGDGDYPVLLDGKPVRTPARKLLAAPTQALAQALAVEWHAQIDLIDPAAMPLTRLANAVIDAVTMQMVPVVDEIAAYLGTDLVCYRAGAPEGLVARQAEHWDPVLAFAREHLGARFVQVEGVMHQAQPKEAIEAAVHAIPGNAWQLGAASLVTTMTGSALLALALARKAMTADAVWTAAHVDEDWQMSLWGIDTMALKRREFRYKEFIAAATVLELTA